MPLGGFFGGVKFVEVGVQLARRYDGRILALERP